jgi:DNA-binding NarL/FixJ family response regulator
MRNQNAEEPSLISPGKDKEFSQNGIKWVFQPSIQLSDHADSGNLLESKELLLFALNNIQDGVSILDTELHIRYVNTSMQHWYSGSGNLVKEKCYRVFHNRHEPCDNCPILKTIADKAPYVGIVKYSAGGSDMGWQQLFSIPIFDSKNNLIGVLEYIRDITLQSRLEIDLNLIMEENQNLEKRNEAISQLLAQRKKEREQLEETITQNVEKFIRPSLHILKNKTNKEDLSLIENLIEEIVYPITKKRSSVLENLTSRELYVAKAIKEGKTSSEIALELCVSKKTVDFHRANIRKKLGLNGEGETRTSLRGFLESHI